MAQSNSGDEIWVKEGTYKPGTSRSNTFRLKTGVEMYGGFVGTETSRDQRDWRHHETILSGDIGTPNDNSDNVYHVVTGADDAVLDGFTVTGGNANGRGGDEYGGGVINWHYKLTLRNVILINNSAGANGGGMYNGDNSAATLINVTFSNNSAKNGGGLYNDHNNSTLTNVTFSDNSAASRGGGMFSWGNNPTLTNVTFSNNSAKNGGGLYNHYSSPTLTNVTFSDNSANDGGGLYNYESSPTLINVLIAGSSTHGGDCVNGSGGPLNANSKNNLIEDSAHACGLTDGADGNIIGHEAKVGPLGDYGGATQTVPLLAGSPAIDAGDSASCPATDQRGVERPQGDGCDIGAYEYDPSPKVTSITRADANPTNAAEVHFTVAFSEAVAGVDTADFSLTTTGGVTGATVTTVTDTGDQQHFTVTVNTGNGSGTLRLDVPTTATITDLNGNNLTDLPYTSGETYTVDKTPPMEVGVNLHALYTGHGPNQIAVTFSEAVYDPVGNADPNDVTNPANYILVERGNNSTFDTISCAGGVQANDTAIAIDQVAYDATTFTATLHLNGGQPLPPGHYRLLVCGTTSITDLSGNHLNGGISDAITEFTVLPKTLPSTGFAPGRITLLPTQPKDRAYERMSLWLEIPRVRLQAPIVGVPQASGQWDTTWLGNEIGWLEGTAFPTWRGNAVLTGHVTDANGLPGPFAQLHTLRYDDAIIVHLAGQRYEFRVREILLVRPNDTRYVLKHLERYSYLTLVTCRGYDPARNTYRWRWVVRAVLVSITSDKQ